MLVLGYVKEEQPLIVKPESEPIKYLELPYEETKNAEYALIFKGVTINDKGIFENDYILLNEKLQVENRDLVVAIINGEATFKIFVIEGERKILKPANRDNKEIELKEGDDIKLIKVVKVGDKFGNYTSIISYFIFTNT